MFADFTSWSWIGSAVLVGLGAVAGYILARQIKSQHTRQLEQELDAARKELGDYRTDVNRHFLKTSLLFNKLTDDYREIYEHLATGAQKLCAEQPVTRKPKLPNSNIHPDSRPPSEAITHTTTSDLESNIATPPTEAKPATQNTAQAANYGKHEAEDDLMTEVSATEKSILMEDEEIPLGEESAPAINLNPDTNRSIH